MHNACVLTNAWWKDTPTASFRSGELFTTKPSCKHAHACMCFTHILAKQRSILGSDKHTHTHTHTHTTQAHAWLKTQLHTHMHTHTGWRHTHTHARAQIKTHTQDDMLCAPAVGPPQALCMKHGTACRSTHAPLGPSCSLWCACSYARCSCTCPTFHTQTNIKAYTHKTVRERAWMCV
jgi:hypothetical protein